MESLIAGNTKFSLDLFKKISVIKKKENIFYSPLSISSALAMVYMGARGNTAKQMAEVLRFTNEKEAEVNPGLKQRKQQQEQTQALQFMKTDYDIHAGFKKLMSELNKEGTPYSLSLANRLYGEQTYKFEEKFIQDTETFYEAELETCDFKSNAEDTRVNINNWVEKQTQDKIKNLLARGSINEETILVLVNAIYFKGEWESKFKANDTCERQFQLSKNENKPVQMMHQMDIFGLVLIPEVSSQILEMPYIGEELSMLIILPEGIEDDSTGLERLERELTYEKLIEWTQPDRMDRLAVEVALPKFKMAETYELKDILVSMGMEDAFIAAKSDFSGMSPTDGVVVSKVVHKSFVEVNEEGTEAAAATAVLFETTSAVITRNVFTADHPFLFFIRHNPSQSILFYGRFCSP